MRFSVVIPLYNKAPYIHQSVQSVLSQTFKDFEVIIVDDGSTDYSADVIKGFADERIRFSEQANSGVSIARNNGVAMSKAPYICFLDADDWWEPTFLEEMDGLIKEFPEAGIYGCGYKIINERKCKTRVAPIALPPEFEKGYMNYCQVYSQRLVMPLTSISVCIPRTVFYESGGFPPGVKLGEDFIVWIHIALKHKVAFINKPLANYNQDVALEYRATGSGRLYEPSTHMLWNLSDLEPEEDRNVDYKRLIDVLRVNGLTGYYISDCYHEAAVRELAKVDWSCQPKSIVSFYRIPRFILRIRRFIITSGASLKSFLRGLL